MKFNSGRHMPISHVISWSAGQLVLLVLLLGPWVFLALFLTGQMPI
jgi:hypothetical protein